MFYYIFLNVDCVRISIIYMYVCYSLYRLKGNNYYMFYGDWLYMVVMKMRFWMGDNLVVNRDIFFVVDIECCWG